MYLDRELQVVLSTPIPGVTEDIVIRHSEGKGDELQTWIEHHPTISADVKRLPKHMMAVTIGQREMLRLFHHDAIYAAASDNGSATLLLQNRDELLKAAGVARAVADTLAARSDTKFEITTSA